MSKHDSLFELIQNLTPAEKRYFRIFAKQHTLGEKNNYLLLFDTINSMQIYEEEKIKSKFKGKAFLKQLAVAKNYLFNLILKALRQFNSETNNYQQLLTIISEVEILYSKSLYTICLKQLLRAEKLAKQCDNFWLLTEIEYWKYKVHLALKKHEEEIDSLKQTLDYIEIEKNRVEYRKLNREFFLEFSSSGEADPKNNLEKSKAKLGKSELFKNKSNAKSTRALLDYWEIHRNYLVLELLSGNEKAINKIIEADKHCITIIEANEMLLKNAADNYFVYLSNYGYALAYIDDIKGVREILIKMKKCIDTYHIKSTPRVAVHHMAHYMSLHTTIIHSASSWKEGNGIAENYISYIKKHNEIFPKIEQILILMNLALAQFWQNNYSLANKTIDYILNSAHKKIRIDNHSLVRYLQILNYLFMKAYSEMTYAIKNHEEYLKRNNILYLTDKILLTHLRQLSLHPESQKAVVENLKNELNKLKPEDLESSKINRYINIKSLLSKIETGK